VSPGWEPKRRELRDEPLARHLEELDGLRQAGQVMATEAQESNVVPLLAFLDVDALTRVGDLAQSAVEAYPLGAR
jgi:hypothetical protein